MAKILIVDDDFQTTALFESLVRKNGHEPTSVNQSRNAIHTAETVQPDLILLDIMMEGINGIELCKMFKSIPHLKHIPIVIVSALNDIGSKRDAANAGAIDYLTKPVLSGEFAAKLKVLLG